MDERRKEGDDAQRAAWMAAAQKGDGTAYASLLTSLVPVLRGFVRRRGVDASAVEDVVQEVLLLIHRARHTWRPDRPFDPWLWAVARNATTDALRRQVRERARRERARDQVAAEPPRAPDDPEARLAARELTPGLREALANLPAAQRQALELLYVEQVSVAEAAARAGVSPSALKVRAHRGSRALRAALTREEKS
jgi:RNA polymerase sigma factor (sigma-70 family)